MLMANMELEYLTGLPASRRARIRVFCGHFPFVAVELLGEEVTTITILRDPVERTLSFLRRGSRHHDSRRSGFAGGDLRGPVSVPRLDPGPPGKALRPDDR